LIRCNRQGTLQHASSNRWEFLSADPSESDSAKLAEMYKNVARQRASNRSRSTIFFGDVPQPFRFIGRRHNMPGAGVRNLLPSGLVAVPQGWMRKAAFEVVKAAQEGIAVHWQGCCMKICRLSGRRGWHCARLGQTGGRFRIIEGLREEAGATRRHDNGSW